MTITAPTKAKQIRRDWHLIDVGGKILGRQATSIARLLMGKNKPYYVPYLDCGDYVVVVNAANVSVTGKKKDQKMYQHFSGFPSGLKEKPFKKVIEENPSLIIRQAVSGMLPKNKLRDKMLSRLYIYPKDDHPYQKKLKS